MEIRKFEKQDVPALMRIWNEVVDAGQAFPQEDDLTPESAEEFFSSQSFTGAAVENGEVVGLYILHPNNVGRCGHIANASYAVHREARGLHIGEKLVSDCLAPAKAHGL